MGENTAISDSTNVFFTVVASVALMGAASIPLLQLDAVSRRLLSPPRLQAKRKSEYQYRWEQTLIRATLALRQALLGDGVDVEVERGMTELLTTEAERKELIIRDLLDKTKPTPYIVALELDKEDPRAHREYFLHLAFHDKRVQVALVPFCIQLAQEMEKQLTSTTLCFVADASSGWGLNVFGAVLEQSRAGVAVVREPIWMAALAQLVEKQIIATSKMERVLFALCRLEAWRVRDAVGTARTVVFTLPGQSCTPTLVPLLQRAFPCERHVFCYDGCVSSVQRALASRRKAAPAKTVPLEERLSLSGAAAAAVTAMTTPMASSVVRSVPKLGEALAKLPLVHADTTEAWMASVDAFLRLKEDEKENGYLPFVLKLGNLTTADTDDGGRLALTNALQYVTGSRSRPLADAVVDAAVSAFRDLQESSSAAVKVSERQRLAIEACVFCHRGILIGNKTLMDTVKPAKEWTLKAAKKLTGCACCAPEEEDDDDEEEEALGNSRGPTNGVDLSVPGAFAIGLGQRKSGGSSPSSRPKFVDGKAAFAFDPTAFGKP